MPAAASSGATWRMFFRSSSRPTRPVLILQTPNLPLSPATLRNRAVARIARQAQAPPAAVAGATARAVIMPLPTPISPTPFRPRAVLSAISRTRPSSCPMPHNRCKSSAKPLNRRITACTCAVRSRRRSAGRRIPPPDHLPAAVETSIGCSATPPRTHAQTRPFNGVWRHLCRSHAKLGDRGCISISDLHEAVTFALRDGFARAPRWEDETLGLCTSDGWRISTPAELRWAEPSIMLLTLPLVRSARPAPMIATLPT